MCHIHTFNLCYYFSVSKISLSVLDKPTTSALELGKFLVLEKAIWLGMFFWQRGAGEHIVLIPITLPHTDIPASHPEQEVAV